MIRKIIGKLTYPKDAVRCELGESWVPCLGVPVFDFRLLSSVDFSRPYNYQKIEQNWIGAWGLRNCYMSKNQPL